MSFVDFLKNYKLIFTIAILFAVFFWISLLTFSPFNFKPGTVVEIKKGQTVNEVAHSLKDNNVIKTTSLFNVLISVRRGSVVSGYYLFEHQENLLTVIKRISLGEYGLDMKAITITEGMSVKEISEKIKQSIPEFDSEKFIEIATPFEGYLFPDTYTFFVYEKPEQVLEEMRHNFDSKIKVVDPLISSSNRSLDEIIIMASIVEREATAEARQEVANILWKRLEIGMPLQVDAPFVYSIGKGTEELLMSDLEGDDPYNTYNKTGLTPTPIGNPGLESIKAAINPQNTNYLYFLTGKDGKMYYAKNLEGHKANRLKYLD